MICLDGVGERATGGIIGGAGEDRAPLVGCWLCGGDRFKGEIPF